MVHLVDSARVWRRARRREHETAGRITTNGFTTISANPHRLSCSRLAKRAASSSCSRLAMRAASSSSGFRSRATLPCCLFRSPPGSSPTTPRTKSHVSPCSAAAAIGADADSRLTLTRFNYSHLRSPRPPQKPPPPASFITARRRRAAAAHGRAPRPRSGSLRYFST